MTSDVSGMALETGARAARSRALAVLRVRGRAVGAALLPAAVAVVLLAGGATGQFSGAGWDAARWVVTALALVVLAAAVVFGLIVARARPAVSPTVTITEASAPDLYRLVRDLADRLEVPAPSAIALTPDCDSWLEDRTHPAQGPSPAAQSPSGAAHGVHGAGATGGSFGSGGSAGSGGSGGSEDAGTYSGISPDYHQSEYRQSDDRHPDERRGPVRQWSLGGAHGAASTGVLSRSIKSLASGSPKVKGRSTHSVERRRALAPVAPVLVIGSPFLWWMRVAELRAVLAPVVAGTGPSAHPDIAAARRFVRGLDAAVAVAAEPGRGRLVGAVLRGAGWTARLLLRGCRGHVAEMERGVAAAAAQRAQAVDYGLRIVAQEQVGLAYAGWDRLLTRVALPAWRMGRWPSRLDAGVVAALTELSRRDRLAEGFASRLEERPACDLLEEPGSVDEAASLLAARLFHGGPAQAGPGWQPVDWQAYPEEVVDRTWRADAARLHRVLDAMGIRQPAATGHGGTVPQPPGRTAELGGVPDLRVDLGVDLGVPDLGVPDLFGSSLARVMDHLTAPAAAAHPTASDEGRPSSAAHWTNPAAAFRPAGQGDRPGPGHSEESPQSAGEEAASTGAVTRLGEHPPGPPSTSRTPGTEAPSVPESDPPATFAPSTTSAPGTPAAAATLAAALTAELAREERAREERVRAEQAQAERTRAERTRAERTSAERTSAERGPHEPTQEGPNQAPAPEEPAGQEDRYPQTAASGQRRPDDVFWDSGMVPLFPPQPPRTGREVLADHVTAMVCCAAVDTAGAAPGLDWLDGPALLVDGKRAADLRHHVRSLIDDGDPEPLRGWLTRIGVRPEKPVRLV